MVAAAVSEVLSHQKKQDKMLAQVGVGRRRGPAT
jgi:hypothetical protein